MKHLKALILLIALILPFCFAACDTEEPTTTTPAPTPPSGPTEFPTADELRAMENIYSVLQAHVSPPIEDLTAHDYEYFYNYLSVPRGTEHTNMSMEVCNLGKYMAFNDGVEYLTMTADNRFCLVYKYVTDNEENVWIYRVFENVTSTGHFNSWFTTSSCEVYYLTNSLSYNEFSNAFTVGRTMEQAIAVSPGLAYDLDNRYDRPHRMYGLPDPERPEFPSQTCHLLLEDGVAILRFEATCTTDEWEAQGKPNSELICTEMEFYLNGTAVTVDGIVLSVLTCPADKRPALPNP